MSATIALYATNNANASAIAIAAQARRATECAAYMPTFNPATATTEDKQHYASCVETIYPRPVTHDETLVIKAGLVCMFIGLGIGIWRMRQEDFFDILMGAFFGALGVPVIVACVVGLVFGAVFLFS